MIAIVGAGPAGCLLALLLARRGHPVKLYERRPDPRITATEAGRSINLALAARGKRALDAAGVLDALTPHMVAMSGRLLHPAGGPESFSPYGQGPLEINHSISRAELTRQLVTHAGREPHIAMHFRQRCIGLEAGAPLMQDEDSGRQYAVVADRVIGADGAGSALRKALAAAELITAGNALLDHDYKELTIPPVARQSALTVREALHIWPRRGFMLIALPNADYSFTATLFMPRSGTTSFEALSARGAARAFFAREFADALALMPDFEAQFAAHRQGILGTVRCGPWNVGERLLLIGDAAHAIVPFHGQGMNCALEDSRLLDEYLADDQPDPFARFSAHRRPDADAIAAMSLENYDEMRGEVLDARHQLQRQLELELERRHPRRFIPRYAMVMFHDEIPYSVALRRGQVQQQILDRLTTDDTRVDLAFADALILQRLPRLEEDPAGMLSPPRDPV